MADDGQLYNSRRKVVCAFCKALIWESSQCRRKENRELIRLKYAHANSAITIGFHRLVCIFFNFDRFPPV
jgi:hypothetical protein